MSLECATYQLAAAHVLGLSRYDITNKQHQRYFRQWLQRTGAVSQVAFVAGAQQHTKPGETRWNVLIVADRRWPIVSLKRYKKVYKSEKCAQQVLTEKTDSI